MFEGWNIPRRQRRFSFPPGDKPPRPLAMTKKVSQAKVKDHPRCQILPPGWRRSMTQAERTEFALQAFHPGGALYDPRYRESEIFAKTDGHCAYCWDKPATTVDHILATSRGGNNSRSNVIGACWPCNNEKAALTLEEFRVKRGVKAFPFENYETRNTNAATEANAGRGPAAD